MKPFSKFKLIATVGFSFALLSNNSCNRKSEDSISCNNTMGLDIITTSEPWISSLITNTLESNDVVLEDYGALNAYALKFVRLISVKKVIYNENKLVYFFEYMNFIDETPSWSNGNQFYEENSRYYNIYDCEGSFIEKVSEMQESFNINQQVMYVEDLNFGTRM